MELQDPDMPFDQALKRATHEPIMITFVDRHRCVELAAGTSSSSAPPPPPHSPVEISPHRDGHDADA